MLSIQKKKEKWCVMLTMNKESYPLVVHPNQSFAKFKLGKIQEQIENHKDPERVKNYYFEKAKEFWTKKN